MRLRNVFPLDDDNRNEIIINNNNISIAQMFELRNEMKKLTEKIKNLTVVNALLKKENTNLKKNEINYKTKNDFLCVEKDELSNKIKKSINSLQQMSSQLLNANTKFVEG